MTLFPPLEFEIRAMDFIAEHSNEALMHFSGQISAFGSKIFIIGLILGLWQLNKRKASIKLAGSTLLANMVVSGLKLVIARPRPEGSVYTLTHSMPSGHTATAFAAAATLSYRYPTLRYLLFGIATLVGISRYTLQAHYPLDIFFGAITGLTAAYMTEKYAEKSDTLQGAN